MKLILIIERYVPGRIFEFYLDNIILDWNDPTLSLKIDSRRLLRSFMSLENTTTYFFMLNLVIKWENRYNKHKLIYRTFKD